MLGALGGMSATMDNNEELVVVGPDRQAIDLSFAGKGAARNILSSHRVSRQVIAVCRARVAFPPFVRLYLIC